MKAFFNAVAVFVEIIANFGAGAASLGCGYEPELPEELQK